MIQVAKSLRPSPERDLLDKEAKAERLTSPEPCAHDQITTRIEAIVIDFGMERTHRAAKEWVRNNRPQNVAKAKRDQASAKSKRYFAKATGGAGC